MIYLGPWQPDGEGGWTGPNGFTHAIDMRPISEQAKRSTTAGGKALFWIPETIPDQTQYDLLGERWDVAATPKMRAALRMVPGRPDPTGSDLLGLLWSLFTDASDEEGEHGLKPVRPSKPGRIELHFGGISHVRRYKTTDIHAERIRRMSEREAVWYAEQESLGILPPGHSEKALGFILQQFGIKDENWKDLITDKQNQDKFRKAVPPETTLSDSFTRADENPVAAPWTQCHGTAGSWAIISNNLRKLNAGDASCIYNTPLSGSDQNIQFDQLTGGTQNGPAGRWESTSVATGYGAVPAGGLGIAKWVTGTKTTLATLTSGGTVGLFKIGITGTTLEGFEDGASLGTLTDSSIASGLYAGVTGNSANRNGDNWYAEDAGGGGGTVFIMQSIDRGQFRGTFRGISSP